LGAPGTRTSLTTCDPAFSRGDWAPGQAIPTLDELQARWQVNKETARRAVAALRAEGLVVPVRHRPYRRHLETADHEVAEHLEVPAGTVTARMPTREEAETMSLDRGSPVLAISRTTRDAPGAVLTFVQAVLVGDRVQAAYDQTFPAGDTS
jgi:DNA-binding GntR family transcriptional regulator